MLFNNTPDQTATILENDKTCYPQNQCSYQISQLRTHDLSPVGHRLSLCPRSRGRRDATRTSSPLFAETQTPKTCPSGTKSGQLNRSSLIKPCPKHNPHGLWMVRNVMPRTACRGIGAICGDGQPRDGPRSGAPDGPEPRTSRTVPKPRKATYIYPTCPNSIWQRQS